MVEHLTNEEALLTLKDWFVGLKVGGSIRLIVPNLDFHCEQWLNAKWDEDSFNDSRSDANYSSAGFWGWQNECNPSHPNYNGTYWDVHKSGYNIRKMQFILNKVGYKNIQCEIKSNIHLVATAVKE